MVKATIDVEVTPTELKTKLVQAAIGPISIPRIFLHAVTDRVVPLTPHDDIPFFFELGKIEGNGDRLTIGGT